MKTKRLFKDDVYLKEAEAVITSVADVDGKVLITLDQTVFFPTGGGQSCDKGCIDGFEVLDVYEHDGEIYHQVNMGGNGGSNVDGNMSGNGGNMGGNGGSNVSSTLELSAGKRVKLQLDWQHRFDNMQRHCGEHILSGIFHREFGGVNKGFHMGDQYMTIDISLEEDPKFTKITWEMAKLAELEANRVIWNDLPVISRHFETKKDAQGLPLRKALAIEKDITIVCVGSTDKPADCVACCGTHPSSAGQVGLVKLYKVESNKGMFRIYFDAGQRAFEKMSRQYDTMTQLSNSLSAGDDDIMEKFKSQQEKNREARTQLHLLKKEVIAREVSSMASSFESREFQDASAEGKLPVRKYSLLSQEDLTAIARDVSPYIPKLLFLIHEPSNTVFLCSSEEGSIDCGRLVRENVSIYGGKGGGSKMLARAIFSKYEYIAVFIDLIEKHLR